jgi:Bacterial Ig-like domain (group 3)/FG-GAP-like repeat
MKSLRFVLLFCVFVFAFLLLSPAPAQVFPLGQSAQLHFAQPVAYNTGGPLAESVAVADLNSDGKMDLVVSNGCGVVPYCSEPGEVAVLLGNGDGTFQPAVIYSTGAYAAASVAVADLNGDGKLDLAVANACQNIQDGECYAPGEMAVLLGNGDGTFQPAVAYDAPGDGANLVAIADLKGNGVLDLVVSIPCAEQSCDEGAVGVLLGNGDGTFQAAVLYNSNAGYATGVAIGDANSDGIPDLIVASEASKISVLLGNGDGTFQPAVTYATGCCEPSSVAVGDLRGDGMLDVVVTTEVSGSDAPSVQLLLGNGNGTFQPPVVYNLVGAGRASVTIGDINGDGVPDLITVGDCEHRARYECQGPGKANVLLGNGDGTFQPAVGYSSGGFVGLAVVVGDVNGDGRPDIVAANAQITKQSADGSVAVLLNKTSYSTAIALTSSPNPAQANQMVTLTAAVASNPAVPNGETITFYDGKSSLGTGTTTGGMASLTTSFSKAKTYTIKATYPGDAFHKASTGTVKLIVNL